MKHIFIFFLKEKIVFENNCQINFNTFTFSKKEKWKKSSN